MRGRNAVVSMVKATRVRASTARPETTKREKNRASTSGGERLGAWYAEERGWS